MSTAPEDEEYGLEKNQAVDLQDSSLWTHFHRIVGCMQATKGEESWACLECRRGRCGNDVIKCTCI